MGNNHLHIGVIFGGMSVEHEVSWQSARNIVEAMNPEKYQPVPIFIDKQGNWYQIDRDLLYSDEILGLPAPKSRLEKNRVLMDSEDGELFLLRSPPYAEAEFTGTGRSRLIPRSQTAFECSCGLGFIFAADDDTAMATAVSEVHVSGAWPFRRVE